MVVARLKEEEKKEIKNVDYAKNVFLLENIKKDVYIIKNQLKIGHSNLTRLLHY